MTTLAKTATNKKRKALVEKYADLRASLKRTVLNPKSTEEERDAAQHKLQTLPRNSAKVRYCNRCAVSGRSHAVYRKFGLSRIALRDLGLRGEIPGLVKSSW